MNWVRNNRFLSTFLGVMIVFGGGLAFLLYTSLSRYQQVDTDYRTQVAELHRLQNLHPYPDAASLKMYETARKDYAEAVTSLQTDLARHEPPPEPPVSPIQFQDRLRQTVDDLTHFAQQSGVALPDGFYLGFDQYRSTPPDAAAASPLNAQLNAITDLVTLLIKTRIDKLTSLTRGALPQENTSATAAAAPGAAALRSAKPGGTAPSGSDLVSKQSIEVAFTTLPGSFRESLNNLSRDKRLYIVRAIQVRNQVDKGPPRDDGMNVPGGPGQPVTPTPAPTAPGPDGVPNPPLPEKGVPLRYIVGQERLNVVARLDIVRVQPPTAAQSAAPTSNR